MGSTDEKEFTIEVEKRGKNEDFAFRDLKMWHRECYGGRIVATKFDKAEFVEDAQPKVDEHDLSDPRSYGCVLPMLFDSRPSRPLPHTGSYPDWLLECQRCDDGRALNQGEPLEIAKTAVDGKPRTINSYIKINVFQKDSSQ